MTSPHQPALRYEPTYWLQSQRPYSRESCEKLLKIVVDAQMESFAYDSTEAEALAQTLSRDILGRVKKMNFDRYRLVCTVTIGEKYMQSCCDIFKCLWDMQTDGYAFYVYDTPAVFAIAVLYAVYLD